MSLLPGQILPQSVPWGRVDKAGNVWIDHNWYLLLYNLARYSLPGQSGGGVGPAPEPVDVGASPFEYTAPAAGVLAVSGATMESGSATPSQITIIRQGATVATGLLVGLVPVASGDVVRLVFSQAPTVTFLPAG